VGTQGSVLDVVLDGGDGNSPLVELFRLDRDPSESENLLQDHPSIAAAMLGWLQVFRHLKIEGIPNFLEGQTGFEAAKDWRIN